MKNKGFTLIEMIGVISVLAAVALIATPTVIKSLRQSGEKAYVEQTKVLEETAEKWSIKNAHLLNESDDYFLEIETLVEENYINSNDILDPRDKKKMNGCIVIRYDSDHMQYTFNYTENTCGDLRNS